MQCQTGRAGKMERRRKEVIKHLLGTSVEPRVTRRKFIGGGEGSFPIIPQSVQVLRDFHLKKTVSSEF